VGGRKIGLERVKEIEVGFLLITKLKATSQLNRPIYCEQPARWTYIKVQRTVNLLKHLKLIVFQHLHFYAVSEDDLSCDIDGYLNFGQAK
jgi:hypothetical protein